jgi:hemerythrin
MAFAEWEERYETGNAAIDDQHRHLFELVNDLHDALMAGTAKEKMGATLGSLASYTVEHFRGEERMMVDIAFPGLPEHRRKHEELASQVRRLVADHEAGRLTLPLTLARFLVDWLRHHIEEEDMRMIAWSRAAARP